MRACVCAGLLAGLWEFPSLLQEEKSSDTKQRRALCAGISRVLGTHLTDSLLQYVGEVSLMSITHTFICTQSRSAAVRPPSDASLIGRSQVVHIFSHIHQTYVVHSVRLRDSGTQTHTENAQWLTRSALQEAAVSTGVKKVCILFTQCVCVKPCCVIEATSSC